MSHSSGAGAPRRLRGGSHVTSLVARLRGGLELGGFLWKGLGWPEQCETLQLVLIYLLVWKYFDILVTSRAYHGVPAKPTCLSVSVSVSARGRKDELWVHIFVGGTGLCSVFWYLHQVLHQGGFRMVRRHIYSIMGKETFGMCFVLLIQGWAGCSCPLFHPSHSSNIPLLPSHTYTHTHTSPTLRREERSTHLDPNGVAGLGTLSFFPENLVFFFGDRLLKFRV